MAVTQPGSGVAIRKNRWSIGAPEMLAILLLIHSALSTWQYATRTPMIDYFVFWAVPHSLSLNPATDIYTEQGRRDMGTAMAAEAEKPTASETQRQATYANMQDTLHQGKVDSHGSPFLYTLIGLLSTGDYDGDQSRFALVSGLCLVASVLMLCSLLRISTVITILLLAFLIGNFAPVVTDMGVGNINEIQLFTIALFIMLAGRSRPLWAGIAIGTATMIKPTTAIVLVLAAAVCLADKDYRRTVRLLAGAAIAAVAAFALSAMYFANPKMWIAFVKSLSGTLGEGSWPLENGNYGLSKLLFGGTGPGPAIILILLLGAFFWLVFSTRRKGPAAETAVPNAFAAAGVGCAAMLLSSPLAWVHYYVLLIPLSIYVIQPGQDGAAASLPGGLAVKILAFLPLLMLSAAAQHYLGSTPAAVAAVFNCAVILTLALAMIRIRQQRLSASVTPIPAAAAKRKPSK